MNSEFRNTINQLKAELKFLEEEVQTCILEEDFKAAHYHQKAIRWTQRELEFLNSLTDQKPYLDAQEIDEALHQLLNGQLKSFSIVVVLPPFQDLFINFYFKEAGVIRCELPKEEELFETSDYGYWDRDKKSILAFGFKEVKSGNWFTIEWKILTESSIMDIKAKIAILMFKVLRINMKQPAYLIKRF